MAFERIVQNASESLLGDERLRSNLTDDEAKVSLDWALNWLESRITPARDETEAKQIAQAELTRLRSLLGIVNDLAKRPGALRLADGLAALESMLSGGRPLSRVETLTLLFGLTGAAWQMRARPSGAR
jgi:hypothetical protein